MCAEMHVGPPRRQISVKRSHKTTGENPFLDSRIVTYAHTWRSYFFFATLLRERAVNGRKINCK
jgi:hypothetical protein